SDRAGLVAPKSDGGGTPNIRTNAAKPLLAKMEPIPNKPPPTTTTSAAPAIAFETVVVAPDPVFKPAQDVPAPPGNNEPLIVQKAEQDPGVSSSPAAVPQRGFLQRVNP